MNRQEVIKHLTNRGLSIALLSQLSYTTLMAIALDLGDAILIPKVDDNHELLNKFESFLKARG